MSVVDRYDRQTRLWGAEGQRRLADAHVVALGCTATVAEALKGIVLSGVQAVTLVDDRLVTAEDLSSNYFVQLPMQQEECDDAKPRYVACAMQETLQALNESCVIRAVLLAPHVWVKKYADALDTLIARQHATQACLFAGNVSILLGAEHCSSATNEDEDDVPAPSLLIASDRVVDFSFASPTAALARRMNAPLLCVESHGLFGYVKTYASDRIVTQPGVADDFAVQDLRIFDPFPTLAAWFAAHAPQAVTSESNSCDSTQRVCFSGPMAEHMPYLCILHHAYKLWCAAKGCVRLPPFTATEYAEMAQYVLTLAPAFTTTSKTSAKDTDTSAVHRALPASFQAAYEHCNAGLNYPYRVTLPCALRVLFDDPRCRRPRQAVCEAMTLRLGLPFDANGHAALQYDWHDVRAVLLQQPDVLSWYVLHALWRFCCGDAATPSSHPQLPLCGYLPDMATSSEWYSELRAIYTRQYDADVAVIEAAAWTRLVQDWESAREQPNDIDADMQSTSHENKHYSSNCDAHVTLHEDAVLRGLLHQLTAQVVRNVWHVRLVFFDTFRLTNTPPATSCINMAEQAWRRVLAQRVFYHVTTKTYSDCGCDVDCVQADAENEMQWLKAIKLAILVAQEVRRMRFNTLLKSNTSTAKELTADEVLSCFPGEEEESASHYTCSSTSIGTLYPLLLRLLFMGECIAHGSTLARDELESCAETRLTSWPNDVDDVHDLFAGFIVPQKVLRAACWEVERVGAGEVAAAAAVVGAMAAAEVAKLLTRMHVPQGKGLFYNGLLSVTGTLEEDEKELV